MRHISAAASIILLVATSLFAQQTDTLQVYSKCGEQSHSVLLIRPSSAEPDGSLILLHGYGGNYLTWSEIAPEVNALSERYNLAIIMPEGYNSWYLDDVPSGQCMATFIGSELITFLRDSLTLATDSAGTFIAGFSMGGQGALRIAGDFPMHFGKVASLSGSLDFNRSRLRNEILEQYGQGKRSFLDSASVINQVEKFRSFNDAILIDCGYQDYLFPVSVDFHKKLLDAGIGHVFLNRSGRHDAEYWRESLPFVMVFMLGR